MIKVVGGQKYEFTLTSYVRLSIMQLWFPARRLLRLSRRVAKRIIGWLPLIALFMPLAYLALSQIAKLNAGSESDVFFELASIGLSSVVLLMIKDNLDAEMARGRKLRVQYELCQQARYQLYSRHQALCKAFGMDDIEWDVFSPQVGSVSVRSGGSHITYSSGEISFLNACLDRYRFTLDKIDDQISGADLLDWGALPLDREAINNARDCLESIREILARDAADGSCAGIEDEANELLGYDFQLLASLRRPWNYPLDAARLELVSRFAEANGAEV